MQAAIDTNVISCLLNAEPAAEDAAATLGQYRALGAIKVCGLVYAELLVRFPKQELQSFFRQTSIEMDFSLSLDIWETAGEAWRSYLAVRRKQQATYSCPHCNHQNSFFCAECGHQLGGPRLILPDFTIGAFALHRADLLITLEQSGGFYQRYMPGLKLVII